LCLEAGGDLAHFDARAHRFVRFHIETLEYEGAVDFRQEVRVERNDHGGSDKHTSTFCMSFMSSLLNMTYLSDSPIVPWPHCTCRMVAK
jgi:hypothetical protein